VLSASPCRRARIVGDVGVGPVVATVVPAVVAPAGNIEQPHHTTSWAKARPVNGSVNETAFVDLVRSPNDAWRHSWPPPDDPFGAERVWLSVSERNLAVADASSLPGVRTARGLVGSRPQPDQKRKP